MAAIGPSGEAEAVAADHSAILDDHPVADAHALADRHARVDETVIADLGMPADDDVWMNDRARTDFHTGGDDGERPDRHAFPECDSLFDVREPMHAWRRPPRIGEQFDGACKRKIGLICTEHGARRSLGFVTKDHRRGTCRAKLRDIAWVAEEGEVPGLRVLDAGDSTDVDPSVAFKAAVKAFSDVFEEQRPQYTASAGAAGLKAWGLPCARRRSRGSRGEAARRYRGHSGRAARARARSPPAAPSTVRRARRAT